MVSSCWRARSRMSASTVRPFRAFDEEGEGVVDPHAVSAIVQSRRAVTESGFRAVRHQVPVGGRRSFGASSSSISGITRSQA